jgi:hypothetical protein
MIGPATRYAVSSSVYARAFGDEIVLLEFGTGDYFGLDAVGAAVWRGLERGSSLGEIADDLTKLWDVRRESALEDICALVEDMRKQSLVEVRTG